MMHNKPLLILFVTAATLLSGCIQKSNVPTEERIRKHISSTLEKYPQSTLADIYKGAFQDYLGPAHLIPDSTTAKLFIEKELSEADTIYGDYYTPCGWYGNYYRVNLRIIKEGVISATDFAGAFTRSATGVDSGLVAEWKEVWHTAMETIKERASEIEGFSSDSAKIMKMLERGEYVMHHSRKFDSAYHPHYRIIKREIFEKEILPLLK